MLRVKMQHYSCDFAPVSTYRIRVEQAQIRDDVLFVVDGQYGIGGCSIGEHRDQAAASSSRKPFVDRSTCFGLVGVFAKRFRKGAQQRERLCGLEVYRE